jgi:2-polyprenyl-6-methoxyphenol hydroxylase-like FAD-dependent oxidoreductase
MKIAIVGGGIGGCALALSLHDAGLTDVHIFESSRQRGQVGVGINLLPHAIRELTELGLFDALDSVSVRTGGLGYHNRFGQRIWRETRGLAAGFLWPQLSIHRGELFDVLADAVKDRLGAERVHLGTLIDDPQALAQQYDVVVGCDGVHSAVRAWMHPDEGAPLWNGVTMWRGVTEMPPFLDGRTMVVAGVLIRRIVVYPIRDLPDGRQLINWVAEVRTEEGRPMPKQDWNREVDVAEPRDHFADFDFPWLNVPMMIEHAAQVFVYPMVDRDPLPTWRRGNVVLLGDAAHPMYPVGSNGASQAIIDARILARELATQPSVADALQAYEELRLPATAAVVASNRQAGPERCMEIVAERAPDGFDNLDDVISPDELLQITTNYSGIAGFDKNVLNERPSWSVRSG